jgi:hypothetical protein
MKDAWRRTYSTDVNERWVPPKAQNENIEISETYSTSKLQREFIWGLIARQDLHCALRQLRVSCTLAGTTLGTAVILTGV